MSRAGGDARRRYRRQVDELLGRIEELRRRRELLAAAGVRGRPLAALERKADEMRRQLAATVAARPSGDVAPVGGRPPLAA